MSNLARRLLWFVLWSPVLGSAPDGNAKEQRLERCEATRLQSDKLLARVHALEAEITRLQQLNSAPFHSSLASPMSPSFPVPNSAKLPAIIRRQLESDSEADTRGANMPGNTAPLRSHRRKRHGRGAPHSHPPPQPAPPPLPPPSVPFPPSAPPLPFSPPSAPPPPPSPPLPPLLPGEALVSSLQQLRAYLAELADGPRSLVLAPGSSIGLVGESLQVPAGANLSISGAEGATLHAGQQSRVFDVYGQLTLRGLRLTDGVALTAVAGSTVPEGGLILVLAGGVVTLEHCSLENSVAANGRGGAIAVSGGTLSMHSCVLDDCMAFWTDAALFADTVVAPTEYKGIGGALCLWEGSHSTLTNCSITNSQARLPTIEPCRETCHLVTLPTHRCRETSLRSPLDAARCPRILSNACRSPAAGMPLQSCVVRLG